MEAGLPKRKGARVSSSQGVSERSVRRRSRWRKRKRKRMRPQRGGKRASSDGLRRGNTLAEVILKTGVRALAKRIRNTD